MNTASEVQLREPIDPSTVSSEIQVPVPRLSDHVRLLRLDHSVKQLFVLPGIVVAVGLTDAPINGALALRALLGLAAIVAVASSNYVLNELLDAPFDRMHPTKRLRPAARQSIHFRLAYLQWVICAAVGLLLAHMVSRPMFFSVLSLWIMGCIYNISPVRTKDVPYLDVLSESINNPIRFCVGWYVVTATVLPPVSLLVAYWMLGGYFMALKRFSEYRQIGGALAARYRKSFAFYTEAKLLNSVSFYAATSMLFFGAFIMRYRMEMVFAFPFIAMLMAVYFNLAFSIDSPVQNPEKLYREPRLMFLLAACVIVLVVMSFVDVPWLAQAFPKSGVH
jgi:decaprenyl-phosphate phosphoribosyltransferase